MQGKLWNQNLYWFRNAFVSPREPFDYTYFIPRRAVPIAADSFLPRGGNASYMIHSMGIA